MLIPILYFLVAGSLAAGGSAGGVLLFKRAQQLAAAHLREEDLANIRNLLESEIHLQELRAEAVRLSVDPDAVQRGYYELRNGTITLDEFTRMGALS